MELSRRTLLAAVVGGGVVGTPRLPGLFSGHVRPDHDPETVPDKLVCNEAALQEADLSGKAYDREDIEGMRRKDTWYDEDDVHWGNLKGTPGLPVFRLRVNKLAFEYGDEVRITLRSASTLPRPRSVVGKANLELYTEAGWQEVRALPEGYIAPRPDVEESTYPGWSHEYRFKLTERGVVGAHTEDHGDVLVACPKLSEGRYRFVSAVPSGGNLAVSFDLISGGSTTDAAGPRTSWPVTPARV
jgi:hypothetical protein